MSRRAVAAIVMLSALTLGSSACSAAEEAPERAATATEGGGSEPTQQAGDAAAAEPGEAVTADGIEIVDFGFGGDEFTVDAITLLKVVDDDLVGRTVDVYVDFLDENGEVIDEDWHYSTINWAQQEIAVGHRIDLDEEAPQDVHAIVPRVELRDLEDDIDRGAQQPLPVLTDATFGEDWSGDYLTVQFEVPEEALDDEVNRVIGIACYDADDVVIGGTMGLIEADDEVTSLEERLTLSGTVDHCTGYMNYTWV